MGAEVGGGTGDGAPERYWYLCDPALSMGLVCGGERTGEVNMVAWANEASPTRVVVLGWATGGGGGAMLPWAGWPWNEVKAFGFEGPAT
jgi:hypothetical protein